MIVLEAPAIEVEEREPDTVIRRSVQRLSVDDGTRLSAELTETGVQETKDVITHEAGASGEEPRPIK